MNSSLSNDLPLPSLPSLPFTIYPDKSTMLRMSLVCVLITIAGGALVGIGIQKGWVIVVIGALMGTNFLISMHPRCASLTVTDEGLIYREIFVTHWIPWSNISHFGVFGKGNGAAVGFSYSGTYKPWRRSREYYEKQTGFEARLPDNYGLKATDLEKLLTLYHKRYMEHHAADIGMQFRGL